MEGCESSPCSSPQPNKKVRRSDMIISIDWNQCLQRLSDKPKMAWREQGWTRVLSRDWLPRQSTHLNHTGFFLGRDHRVIESEHMRNYWVLSPCPHPMRKSFPHYFCQVVHKPLLESSRGWNLTTPPQSLFHMVMSWGQKSTENIVREFKPQFSP